MGGPWHGQEHVYFSEQMPVEQYLGGPTASQSWRVNGHYQHDGRGLWVWFGPEIEAVPDR
jgi:hypothetical protein